jgi:DNA invertase Pin-like site-specific DNA recombinase
MNTLEATPVQRQAAVPASAVVAYRLTPTKIQAAHRDRLAVVYVRQSTPQQVLENRESTARQYALADLATTWGWLAPRVLVVDEDQGQSGRSADHRTGFQRLLAEVTMDHVGLILALEMSRLARSNKDWHHLLELCALFGTLLADQDGVYDPSDTTGFCWGSEAP